MTTAGALGRQVSSGVIVALSAVIYALSYGTLMFSGSLAPFVGYGITIALISAAVGAAFGWLSGDRSFILGPDSNTISVLSTLLAGVGALGLAGQHALHLAVASAVATSLLCSALFYGVARARLSALARFLPYSVTAGFLASTGWLMTSGALNIISGTPLSAAGLKALLDDPVRPELWLGCAVAGALFALSGRIAGAVLIPLAVATVTLLVDGVLSSGVCQGPWCDGARWLFPSLPGAQWLPPWRLDLPISDLGVLMGELPLMMVVGFVGVLTILLSLASLELSNDREFSLDRALGAHALAGAATAALGGFVGIISISRSTLNRQTGGGRLSGALAGALCLATLFGAGALLSYIPRAALGGLVLYLGMAMLKQWVLDQRHTATKAEFAQILLILALVANFGFMVGFSAGLLIACVVFVLTYSQVPLVKLDTTLALFASTVVRPESDREALCRLGANTRLLRLTGYVFFGSTSKIEAAFRATDREVEGVVIDFGAVSGIDSSAIGVFQRILKRHRDRQTRFFLACGAANEARVRAIVPEDCRSLVRFFPSLDYAVEAAEDAILARHAGERPEAAGFAFLAPTDRDAFLAHCERRHLRHGDILCREGEMSNEIYFLESGGLEIFKHAEPAPLRLAKLLPGAMVGELAFYTGEARKASIVAAEDSTVLVLRRDALARLRSARPDLASGFDHMVIHKLSRDLSGLNTLVTMFR